MVDIEIWLKSFMAKVEQSFHGRVWFIGLQGSYGRGEATDSSDIDVVVILDKCDTCDLKAYGELLDTLPHREYICGFVSGKDELLNWEPSDLFQFYYDTTPIKGSLDILLEKIDMQAVQRAIRIGACNIYHACAHNIVHEKSDDILRSLYKSAVFVIQAVCFCQTGRYVKSKADLLAVVDAPEKVILDTALELKSGSEVEFDKMSADMLNWVKEILNSGV